MAKPCSSTDRDWVVTAFSATLWINPAIESLVRLAVRTGQLPATSGACAAATRVDYQQVHLGSGDFLLPLESELHFLLPQQRYAIFAML